MAKVCQALACTRSSERTGKTRALSYPKLYGRLGDDGYCFAVSKLSGRIEIVAMAFVVPEPCGRIEW